MLLYKESGSSVSVFPKKNISFLLLLLFAFVVVLLLLLLLFL